MVMNASAKDAHSNMFQAQVVPRAKLKAKVRAQGKERPRARAEAQGGASRSDALQMLTGTTISVPNVIKKHLPDGGCICKDNQWNALDGAGREACAFYAGGESREAYQESAIAAVDHLQQHIDDESISEDDLHSSTKVLLSAYQGMLKHAANAKREADAKFTEQEPKHQKEGMSQIESLLSCVQERRNAHMHGTLGHCREYVQGLCGGMGKTRTH